MRNRNLSGLFACVPALFALPIVVSALPADPPTATATKAPQDTQKALNVAMKQAKAAKKNVLVIFHASWCGWCKRLDGVLDKPEYRKTMADNYVIVHLDVEEHDPAKKSLENPGGGELMNKLGGEKSGLPFYAFLDSKGKKLADSNVMPNNQNIGYPGSPEEIAAFEKLLQQTAPKMTDTQRGNLIAYLKANAPKPQPLLPSQ